MSTLTGPEVAGSIADVFAAFANDVRAPLLNEIHFLKEHIVVLEEKRPQWAKGYTSDSVAAQCSHDALFAIYKILGVSNQTEAMQKLEYMFK